MSPSPSVKRWRDASGFTLIEVLIAFCVVATLLSILYRGVVIMRQSTNAFDEHTGRDLVIRDVLDTALAVRVMRPGTYHGTRNGHRWTLVARNVDLRGLLPPRADTTKTGAPGQPTTPETPKSEWTTQHLSLRLETPGRPLEIETIRLVRAER